LAQKSEDLRIQRTRKLLRQALFELTTEQGFAAVTVRDIAARAMVNRSTFYRHYLDKYDLLNQYLEELQALTVEAAALAAPSPEKVPAGLLVLIRHVQEYAEFYRVMLGPHGDQTFTYRFRQLSETRYRTLFSRRGAAPDSASAPTALRLSYISSAMVGALLWWLENDQPCPAEQLAIWLGQLNMTSAGLVPLAP
jgi:AcrR family transcriptional regulator